MEKSKGLVVLAAVLVLLIPHASHAAALFYIDDAGKIGIGNSDPQSKLDVFGALYSRLNALTASSSLSINWDLANVHTLDLNQPTTTLAFSNGHAGAEYKLLLTQDVSGGRHVSWPSSVIWPSGVAPTLSTTSQATDVISFVNSGNYYLGTSILAYPAATLFSDDFHRADNGSTVGNGWSQHTAGSGTSQGISSNRYFSVSSNNGGSFIYRSDIATSSGIKVLTRFTAADLTDWFWIAMKVRASVPSHTSQDGYGIALQCAGGAIGIEDQATELATSSITCVNGDTYVMEMDISAEPQNWIDAYVWDESTGSKPGTPTVSFHNNGSNYAPSANGSNFTFDPRSLSAGNTTLYSYLYQVSR